MRVENKGEVDVAPSRNRGAFLARVLEAPAVAYDRSDVAHWCFPDEEDSVGRLGSPQHRRRLIMTRARTRRHHSRLLLLSFSSSRALHLRHSLLLLILGLSNVRSNSPCSPKATAQSQGTPAAPSKPIDVAEGGYLPWERLELRSSNAKIIHDRPGSVQENPRDREIDLDSSIDREINVDSLIHRQTHVDSPLNPETDTKHEDSKFHEGHESVTACDYHGEHFKQREQGKFGGWKFAVGDNAGDKLHPRDDARRIEGDNIDGNRGSSDFKPPDAYPGALKALEGNSEVKGEESRKGAENREIRIVDRSATSLNTSRGFAKSSRYIRESKSTAGRGSLEGGHDEADHSRIGRSSGEPDGNKANKTEEQTSSIGISQDLTSPSNESVEEPFTGFEGSQKFPVRVTHKPPAPPQVEKIDRRHFGPPKIEASEDTTYPSTLQPDLPKSPSRDVLHRLRKVEDGGVEEEREEEVLERGERGNETDSGLSLPGTLPGRRSSNQPAAKSFPEEKYVSMIPSTLSTSASTSAVEMDLEYTVRVVGEEEEEEEEKEEEEEEEEEGDKEDGGITVSNVQSIEKINVTILGLFEMTRGTEPRPEGPSELQAAKLAVERVNEMNFLPKFRLRLIYNDTKCDPGVAVDRFFHALYSARKNDLIPLLLGTACSEVTETLAKIVPYWNVIQVSFGSTAPALSDSTEFPLFVRTVAPDSSHNPARIALIKHFGWDTVTALSQTGDMYSLAVNDLVTELEQANITCTATITFAENDYKEQLRTLKELDTRIIIGSFSPRLAPRVFCEAWKLGMHGGDYAWILPGDTIDLSGMTGDWWHSGPEECSPSQLSQTLDGLIIVKSHGTALGNEISSSGLTSGKFITELAKRGVTHTKFAAQTYDAVWAMALALARTEESLNLRNSSMAQYTHVRRDFAQDLLEQLKQLRFIGVSGPVSFDGADRVGITAFYQMHGHVIRRIAIFTPEDGKLIMNCPGCAATRWPGGHPPAARRVFRLRVVTVAPAAFLAVTCLASVGVTLALAFLAFNLHFRKHKSIKLSSPRLNNMAAVGCGLVYGAVILLGLDHATLPDSDGYYPAVCTARVYLLSAGFSLAFGSMFTKTYRVHRIFTRSRSGVVKNKLLQDTQLISLICVLLLIDGLVVTLWVTLDPMQRHLRNLTLEISPQDRGVVYQPQVEVCRSQHTNGWLGALYVYKGLLLVVGVYMAWETRHVKIPALNDSQYIGMSVYSVVITSGIVVVLANLMSDRATLAFVTITTLILASTTATLALLFLPQLANILAGERADPVVQSLGLKIECNTRRFVTDDRRELQYRVEVQNRVYRREMAQLELELARLEKQLAQEPVEPSHASSSASIPQRNPSIGGGLPLLLLSVLPPVIPRASWPSADPSGVRER
ncbi:hypothetical protein KM043_002659 [Ampulex compressa]|nr:hypothetical protein KM043_002659 [Ampulex compressa]